MRIRRLIPLLLIALLLLVAALVRCGPRGDEARPFPDPQAQDAPALPPGAQLPEVTLQPGQAIVPRQLAISGGGADIDRVLAEIPELALERIASVGYDYLERYPPPGDDAPQTQGKRLRSEPQAPASQAIAPEARLDLYQLTSGSPSLSDALQLIAGKVEELQDELLLGVVAEPNYVVGFEISGDPWAIEGSPWAIEGSPWAIEGSGEEEAGDDVVHGSDYFWRQWALQPSPGINLIAPGGAHTDRTIAADGAGVQVAIFDASPFAAEGGYRFDGWGPPDIAPLALAVSHPVSLPTSDAASAVNIADHGLFVAGLVYAAAPAADLHLVRVLNDEGQGTLQAFVEALGLYFRARLAEQGSLQNTVINLSLGTAEPDDQELPPEARRAIARMLAQWDGREVNENRLPVLSLEIPMLIAQRYGASVVAAAGNDSAEQAGALPAQIPAAYDSVVGVEAGNQSPARSCYSNEGDLRAPGGDGDAGEGAACVPAHDECPTDSGDCGFGVISYTLVAQRGFAYWVGSSFATPLVSGVAAAITQAQGSPPPAAVQSALLCGAAGGVLDAAAASGSCP